MDEILNCDDSYESYNEKYFFADVAKHFTFPML